MGRPADVNRMFGDVPRVRTMRATAPGGSIVTEQPRQVGVLVFDGAEDLDFIGPLEVWGMASRLIKSGLEVRTVGRTSAPIRTSFGLLVTPHLSFADAPQFDILVVPGGSGAWALLDDEEISSWLARAAADAELVTSVCSGAMLLGAAGVLGRGPVTTHWNAMARMRARFPDLEVREGVRWVDAGRVVTSAGVSAGIDMSLHLVERLYGHEIASETARWLEYDPWLDQDRRARAVPASATS